MTGMTLKTRCANFGIVPNANGLRSRAAVDEAAPALRWHA
jgi:hypothetical protein